MSTCLLGFRIERYFCVTCRYTPCQRSLQPSPFVPVLSNTSVICEGQDKPKCWTIQYSCENTRDLRRNESAVCTGALCFVTMSVLNKHLAFRLRSPATLMSFSLNPNVTIAFSFLIVSLVLL